MHSFALILSPLRHLEPLVWVRTRYSDTGLVKAIFVCAGVSCAPPDPFFFLGTLYLYPYAPWVTQGMWSAGSLLFADTWEVRLSATLVSYC